MKSSWKICTLFGIEFRIHATFPMLLLWIAAIDFAAGYGAGEIAVGTGFTLAIFGLVVLHELGHILMAKIFGVRARDITLFPFGGVARLDRTPCTPTQEVWIALAGPAVNALLAIVLLSIVAAQRGSAIEEVQVVQRGFLAQLAWANVALALFNLVPAFPMDGGRVLRALLAFKIGSVRATEIAVLAGKGFAILFCILGVATNPILVIAAVFVWFGAEQEGGAARLRAALEGVPVEDVMMTKFHVLSPYEDLLNAVYFALTSGQRHFPVVADGAVVGMLSWNELLAGLSARGAAVRVADMMRSVRTLHEDDLLERVIDCEQDGYIRAMPVLRAGRIVGLLTPESLLGTISLRAAAERAARLEADALLPDSRVHWWEPVDETSEARTLMVTRPHT